VTTRTAIVANAVLFQAAWLIAVAGAARDFWYAGPIAVGLFAVWQLANASQPGTDVLLILFAIASGLVADSAFARSGLITYSSPVPSASWAPLWILALWANFALSLNHSLAWLQSKLWLACLFGAIGGPLSYFLAARTWHAVTLAEPSWLTLAAIAVTWALVTPVLCRAAAGMAHGLCKSLPVRGSP
jgi:Protein of unknown function (DUF2878)